MTQAVTRYQVVFESLRSRRRRPIVPRGLDAAANWLAVQARHARTRLPFLEREARRIDALTPEVRHYSEAALDDAVSRVREAFIRGRQDAEGVRRALAFIREIARRETGEEPFVVQLMGAMGLYHGRVVQMVTGEGKTLTGSLAAPLLAWRHRYLHVFTVNDYLAGRDARSRAGIYKRCLLGVGSIQQEMEAGERAEVYARAIVYGTPKQITADWLRDQLRLGRITTAWGGRHLASGPGPLGGGHAGPMIPGLHAALVDEADAVLIDEGVVPLIIAQSRRQDDMAEAYTRAAAIAARLDEGPDYSIDHLRRRADLKRRGQHRCRQIFAESEAPIWKAVRRGEELVRQALVARHCYLNGRQYQIVEGRVVIVDEYTGRFLPDRSWEHGLHQAVEAKEGLTVTADRETLARQSFQRFFRSYPVLSGMTGTIADARVEIERVYSRPVTLIPTNRPLIRAHRPTRVFRTPEAKWAAIVESIERVHREGRAVLIGTRSIAASEHLAGLLTARALPHRVLNANFDKEEADLIAQAGRAGAITVATNMAGRGTDILLDARSRAAGGLHVVLTEMHGAQRIDRQFIGRAGRQGDPGSGQIFVSLRDELVSRHTPHLARWLAVRTGGGDELSDPRLARLLFRLAQRRSEARDRRNRGSVLRHDDWIEKHLPGSG